MLAATFHAAAPLLVTFDVLILLPSLPLITTPMFFMLFDISAGARAPVRGARTRVVEAHSV